MRDEERRLIEILLPGEIREIPTRFQDLRAAAATEDIAVVVSGIFAGKCMLDSPFSLSTAVS